MQTDLLSFSQKLVTYAQWDDTRDMVLRATTNASDPRIDAYMATAFPLNIFEALGIEFALFYDLEGRLVAKTQRESLNVPQHLKSLSPGGPLWGGGKGCYWGSSGYFSTATDDEVEVCTVMTRLLIMIMIKTAHARARTERWPWKGGSRPRLRSLPQGYFDAGAAGFDEIRRCYGEDGAGRSGRDALDRIAGYFSILSIFPDDGHILIRVDRQRECARARIYMQAPGRTPP
eukprot:tig00021036_g17345.t1